ncbi:MAG: M48 family metallopeptidase [Bacillaceae bacterium]|mgnify:CR=1 FL=1|uniref:Protease HtpX homolog n=1 Tax=Alkalihalobacterium chitinilyticum TaxID=2980103 RepID=A0ABT5VJ73_9BACI|nr:M48 family metallopeptidase [Alkalihalobacterium chitinilyticum]MDE5415507.1 M48 family metallopeptidase [Alkalihalobacterium chitinilyticum]MEB1809373.1 M48 family metallopeptidase [Bacillaceae bacterium]
MTKTREKDLRYLMSGEEIRKNKFNSILLLIVFFSLIVGAGALYGYLEGDVITFTFITMAITGAYLLFNFVTFKFMIKKSINGRLVTKDTQDEKLRTLYYIVERLSVGCNIKMPEIYVIPTNIPNAFATGFNHNNAIVGVTEGLLHMLDEEELEGVMAHEFAHIMNYDIRLKAVTIALTSSFVLLAEIIYRNMRVKGRSRNNNNDSKNTALLFVVVLIILVFSRVISALLSSAISRQREYMADTKAVRITSNNRGLINALAKIGGYRPRYSKSEYEAQLGGNNLKSSYIYNHFSKKSASLFSTHPPIEDRIQKLERTI